MRIISGRAKGRRLKAPPLGLRPTSSSVRSALFNILQERIVDATFLDLCAGTGSVGIEALSRGAKRVIFVEKNRAFVEILRENVVRCGMMDRALIIQEDAVFFLKKMSRNNERYDFLFFDPPYDSPAHEKVLRFFEKSDIITHLKVLVIQHPSKRIPVERMGSFYVVKRYCYGRSMLSLYVQDLSGPLTSQGGTEERGNRLT